ncbi:MAG TPA: S9 family peptidase, partial [Aggregicoccus sp.]|nr:S9 family peptidase [Aggregicoccus sp.]
MGLWTSLALLSATALAAPPAAAPSPPGTERGFIHQLTRSNNFNAGRPLAVRITPDERTVLFLRSPADSRVNTLFAFDVASGQTRELLTPAQLLQGGEETLSAEEKARRERMRVTVSGLTSYALSADGKRLLLTLGGKLYVVERASGKVRALAT